ncbi:2-oxoglutarate dehydrogenase complex dihydrolipoyllysine-residue succinyltransferase [Paenibacillus sp. L3-i20]|uniref:2-oxoglutarate dehydrogenase complex dihydrolipoyllysine-residue succinyltransferase n=1 Tax=Paenibacillus sp. L3-i20 TaxID=2905833 RepID=UPI001EE0E179|nr:2-oxoglutarate dehydrogenase complex dihydrolipoyllysine-residue succinyltransferase [Paenibacillus sp. L3-i20]GKU75895.1 dihydrolipoyllysine-residue succinyltransferase component of 2-oxoglutarate dehydrogenase complex [Paenibacillus sp. L3-i20]
MADIIVPELGESISEGTITKWFVKEGDTVNQGDVLLELETDKVNIEISSDSSGVVSSIAKKDGEVVLVGEAIGSIGASTGAPATPAPVATPEKPKAPEAAAPAPAAVAPAAAPTGVAVSLAASVNATPAARKLAREQGIDLTQVQGKDGIGRIYPDDIRSHGVQAPVAAAPAAAPAAPAAPAVNGKETERKRMSRRRVTIANRLVEAQRTAAMLTTFNEVDMTAILDLRKRRKQAFFDKNEVNLGFMSFFTKAVVGALKAYPLLNAEIDGEDIVVKKFYDIGIAVSAKEGLVVPVVRDADRLSFADIEKNIGELAKKARANTLALSDLQGGSFTITNGGVFGSLLSTPILNTPQVGILGMHKIQIRPVAIDDVNMENRPMMYIALSYDHRIVDGSEAVRFLVTVKELLEDPEQLLLQG